MLSITFQSLCKMHFPDDNETFPPDSVLWLFPYSKPTCIENPYLEDHSADVTMYSFQLL